MARRVCTLIDVSFCTLLIEKIGRYRSTLEELTSLDFGIFGALTEKPVDLASLEGHGAFELSGLDRVVTIYQQAIATVNGDDVIVEFDFKQASSARHRSDRTGMAVGGLPHDRGRGAASWCSHFASPIEGENF